MRIDPRTGAWSVLDKRCRRQWISATEYKSESPRFRRVAAVPESGDALQFEAAFSWTENQPIYTQVTIRLPADSADLHITADMEDRTRKIGASRFWDPLGADVDGLGIAVADYCNGHLYPADTESLPRRWFSTSRLDMPWVGVCEGTRGPAVLVLFETSDDGAVELVKRDVAGRSLFLPQAIWQDSKGAFSYPRRLTYAFAAEGGYVALAKRYRQYASQLGLIVPFAEKVKANPEIRRLFGAPDVWGYAALEFAQAAKDAGVRRLLVQGRMPPDSMRQVNELGYITSEYDNYTDITAVDSEDKIDRSHDFIPQSVVLRADGERMTAWLTFDKKTQFMKRCPALWLRTARRDIPKILGEYPFLGRFIDVTTAEDLYECYDPEHPLTRADKRRCGEELLAYVRSQKLVVGGEHGIWWAVPYTDYFEGMMSGGNYSWPAGHLIAPKTKDERFHSPWGQELPPWQEYEKWGIGHRYRVPLWELVFHDCVVTTWYWGDSSDFLLQAAPEITPKKDAYNILYGTIPLLWADARRGSWRNHRDVFLRTYRNTCILHEAIAGTEMLDHEFLTEDRRVQKTTFSDGTWAVVNFGPEPYELAADGRHWVLPENGFVVKGPAVEQSRVVTDGGVVTAIHGPDFDFSETE
ncbi:hypothetical protein JCM17478_19520 [Thermopirellula anaerolimosa]